MTSNTIPRGICPLKWGPLFWHFLHSLAEQYPTVVDDDKETAIGVMKILKNLMYVLPCLKCRKNLYNEIIHHLTIPTIFPTKLQCVLWVFTLHNCVNVRLKKEVFTLTQYHKTYKTVKQTAIYQIIWRLIYVIAYNSVTDDSINVLRIHSFISDLLSLYYRIQLIGSHIRQKLVVDRYRNDTLVDRCIYIHSLLHDHVIAETTYRNCDDIFDTHIYKTNT